MEKGSDEEQQSVADAHSSPETSLSQDLSKDKYQGEGAGLGLPTKDDPAGQPAPFDPPFAPLRMPLTFWQDAVLLSVLGGALGALGYGFLQAIAQFTDLWLQAGGRASYPSAATLGFGSGEPWWIGVTAGAGLAVGLARAMFHLETAPTFIEELREMHCDPVTGLKTGVVTLLSLMGGVPMGPEAGLGALAAAAGTLLSSRLRGFKVQPEPRRRLYVLSAMCSVFGALMPSPLVAILLVVELARPFGLLSLHYMHIIAILACGTTASFAVYFGIAGYTYYRPIDLLATQSSGLGLDSMDIVTGIVFGLGGSVFGLVYVLIAGLVKVVARSFRSKLDAAIGRWPRVVVMATCGGAVIGALGWAMPLVLTDGSTQMGAVTVSGMEIGSSALAAAAFTKVFAYHLASECGFSGGLFLPMLSMSSCLGRVFVNITPDLNPVVGMACATVALGGSLIPAPVMLSLLANSMLLVGPQGLVPIFTTAVTAHLFCMGIGLPQGLMAAVARRKAKRAAASAAAL
ncbi:hypothetical protein D9Q98_000263 [Chlorella vulgaris]|uniref:Chloride channel protein n=1 Tax=Chlorella vulgaris TaxID=3077 RepID=A0A9D4Z208_CHLVU|nr:hypothetical protein D9Q98_000263 [Chlorella vulgaris]